MEHGLLPIRLHPYIILALVGLCDDNGKLTVSFDELSDILSDEFKELINFKTYVNMCRHSDDIFTPDLITLSDGNTYSISSCNITTAKSYHYLANEVLRKKYAEMKLRFDIWYILHVKVGNTKNIKYFLNSILNYSFITPDLIDTMLHGTQMKLDDILGYIVDEQKVDVDDEKYTKLVIRALKELCVDHCSFETRCIEFWCGTCKTFSGEDVKKFKLIIKNTDSSYTMPNMTPVKANTCTRTLYVPHYTTDINDSERDELRKFFKIDIDDTNILKLIIKKRLYDSIITGLDISREGGHGFHFS